MGACWMCVAVRGEGGGTGIGVSRGLEATAGSGFNLNTVRAQPV